MDKNPLYPIKRSNNILQQYMNNKVKKKSSKNKSIKSSNHPINITKKINYKFYSNYPIIRTGITFINDYNIKSKEKYYWFAAYDNLIKTKKLLKIFSFYNIASRDSISFGNEKLYNDFAQIKEKKLEIKNYELYYVKNNDNKPFIRKSEGNLIYAKLYLLNLKQLNMIFSYINKIEFDDYFKTLDNLKQKGKYINIFRDNNLNINYPTIYCLGSFMNIGIYSFSREIKEKELLKPDGNNTNIEINLTPNSKKIAKLIKILLMNFPEYSKEYFIDYIFQYFKSVPNANNDVNTKILLDKKNEINHLLISNKKSLYKINSGGLGSGLGSRIPENSFSPYLSSFNNNNSNKLNSNSNNNIANNMNNNLGTISYNESCFDFTSDFLISMRQNEENISKILGSIKNFSNRNKNSISNNINTNSNTNNKITLTLSNEYNSSNNYNNMIKQPNTDMGIKVQKNSLKISNFSVDKDSKNNLKKSMKIQVNRKINLMMNDKRKKNLLLPRDIIKKLENYKMPKFDSKIIYKPHTSFHLIQKKMLSNTPMNSIEHISSFNNDNKENCNSISNFGEINFKNSKKNFNFCRNNKSSMKGEDIFLQSSNNFKRNSNSSFMYILDKNGVKSLDFKNIQKSKKFRLSSTSQLNHYQ